MELDPQRYNVFFKNLNHNNNTMTTVNAFKRVVYTSGHKCFTKGTFLGACDLHIVVI